MGWKIINNEGNLIVYPQPLQTQQIIEYLHLTGANSNINKVELIKDLSSYISYFERPKAVYNITIDLDNSRRMDIMM